MLFHDRNDDSQLLEQKLFRNNINIFYQYLVNNNRIHNESIVKNDKQLQIIYQAPVMTTPTSLHRPSLE